MSSVNRVTLIGNLGHDPSIKAMQSGDKVASFSLATSESWKDKESGEKKENVQWHKIVVWNQHIVKVIENYVKKGSKIYVEGQLETRKWQDKDGADKYMTEIVLRPYKGEIVLLGGKDQKQDDAPVEEDKSEIPF